MVTKDQAVLDALDFNHDIPCDHRAHSLCHTPEQPAMFFVHVTMCCGPDRAGFLCLSGWERAGVKGLTCQTCKRWAPREQCWTIVRVIGSTP